MPYERLRPALDLIITSVAERRMAEIKGSHSLTEDLGFDSLRLMQLFAAIDERFDGVDLTPWFARCAAAGADTVDGLCAFIAAATGATAPQGA